MFMRCVKKDTAKKNNLVKHVYDDFFFVRLNDMRTQKNKLLYEKLES